MSTQRGGKPSPAPLGTILDPTQRQVWELIDAADKAYEELEDTPPRHVGHKHRVGPPRHHHGPAR